MPEKNTMNNIYNLNNVTKRVDEFELKMDHCVLEQGGLHVVVGPNGSGKSTFLNLLSLIDQPTTGNIMFNGMAVNSQNSANLVNMRRHISYLTQNPYLFHMSVRDNVGYGLKIRRTPSREIKRRVNDVLALLGISDLADRQAYSLSGGEAQRAALARTFVLDAEVYLLDEPTANIDHNNVYLIEELIRNENRTKNATIVLSTHSREQAYRMSPNVISIIAGRIHDVAYENIFSGTLKVEADGVCSVTIAKNIQLRIAQGKPGNFTAAIDPEDILLSRNEIKSSALNMFPGTISRVEQVNGSLRVFVDAGAMFCAMVTRRSFLDMGMNIGEKVWITFKANAVKIIS